MSTKDAQSHFDQAKAEAFPEQLLSALNNGALCLMVSVGHRTGLFDVMSKLPLATPEEIAVRAGLHERYVREWLRAMVTARVVELDPRTLRFSLDHPPDDPLKIALGKNLIGRVRKVLVQALAGDSGQFAQVSLD
jgi:hypothetical protein